MEICGNAADQPRTLESPGKSQCECCDVTENLKICCRCRAAFYCSSEHQLLDWKKHKRKCKKTAAKQGEKLKTSLPVSTSGPPNSNSGDQDRDVASKGVCELPKAKNTNEQHKQVSQTHSRRDEKVESIQSSDNAEHSGNEMKVKPEICFDPRPYIHKVFPKPASRNMDTMTKHTAVQLKRNNYCVLDEFLEEDSARRILQEVISIRDSGILIDGPLSGGRTSSETSKKFTKKAIRGDKITWLDGNADQYPGIQVFISEMDRLVQRLNFYLEGLCNISGRAKPMVACYPGNGTGYAYHVDNPNRDGRCITCLYYLNDNWDVKMKGGLLRLLPASGDYVDVEPILNRLLLFWSDHRNPHEVQPAYDMRYAITIWYFDKAEREEAKIVQLNEEMSKLRGNVSLPDVEERKERRDQVVQEIQKKSADAVAGLSHEELQALSTMLEGQADPRSVLSRLGVAPSIQGALLRHLKEMNSTGKH